MSKNDTVTTDLHQGRENQGQKAYHLSKLSVIAMQIGILRLLTLFGLNNQQWK